MPLLLVVALLANGQPRDGSQTVDPHALLEDMRAVARKTYAVYSNMNVKGTIKLDRKTADGTASPMVYDFAYSGSGPLQSLQTSTIDEIDGEKVYVDQEILSVSPKVRYLCRRQSPTSDYSLESNSVSQDYFTHLGLTKLRSVLSPCFVGPFSLPKLVESPYFRIGQIERVDRGGLSLLKITFSVEPPEAYSKKASERTKAEAKRDAEWSEDRLMLPEPFRSTNGWMLVDPAHGYVVHEAEVETMLFTGNSRHCTSRVEYTEDQETPIPRPAYVHCIGDSTFKLASYDFDVKPESFFTLKRLGLGDYPQEKPSASRLYYVYNLVFALSLACLAFIFLRGRKTRDFVARNSPV